MAQSNWLAFAVLLASLFAVRSLSAQLPVDDGLLLWLDAADANSITLVDDCVSTWADKSGNGFHAVIPQGNSTACPAYSTDAMNGNPAVRFHSQTADGMEISNISIDERPYTAFIVNQYWGDVRGRTLQGTDSNWMMGLWNGNVGHFASGWVSKLRLPTKENFPYVATAIGGVSESSFLVNGLDTTNDTAPSGNPGGLGLVGSGLFSRELSDADISEVLYYDRELSSAEIGTVQSYLHDKYNALVCQNDVACFLGAGEFNVVAGTVGSFKTSSELDFQGDFAYAVNIGGPGMVEDAEPLVVGDAHFIAGTNEDIDDVDTAGIGVSMTVAHEIPAWFSAAVNEFGDGSIDDDNLAYALQSVRWNQQPGIDVAIEVEPGQGYKLQLLFGEACCERAFDILVEEELVVDNLYVPDVQDGVIDGVANGINKGDTGVSYTYEFMAVDDELNISLGGQTLGVPDNNAILHVLTLEKIALGPCTPDTGGDLDGNGIVELADFTVLFENFGMQVPGHVQGDINCNGKVDFADFLILSPNFGNAVGEAASVPEPASSYLVVLASLIGLVMRQRR